MALSNQHFLNIELLRVPTTLKTLAKVDWEQRYPLSPFPNLKTMRLVDVLEGRLPLIVDEEASVDAVQLEDVPPGIVIENALGNAIA